jgi:hypothetical protein
MKREGLPIWADVLLTLWIILVAVIFFVPSTAPLLGAESLARLIGAWTQPASLAYLFMLIAAVLTLALRFLHRHDEAGRGKL